MKFKNESWEEVLKNLKALAKEKLGTGYQKKIAEKSGLKTSTVQRIFSAKFSPTLKNLHKICKAIDYEIKFIESKKTTNNPKGYFLN